MERNQKLLGGNHDSRTIVPDHRGAIHRKQNATTRNGKAPKRDHGAETEGGEERWPK